VEDLVRFGTLTNEIALLLSACVKGRLNILITGGTGTGKTTLLNVLSSFIPRTTALSRSRTQSSSSLRQDHVVRLEYRPPTSKAGRSDHPRPGAEFPAHAPRPHRGRRSPRRRGTGHAPGHEHRPRGVMSTLHANSPRDALNRLETMVMMAGIELPVKAIREYISSPCDSSCTWPASRTVPAESATSRGHRHGGDLISLQTCSASSTWERRARTVGSTGRSGPPAFARCSPTTSPSRASCCRDRLRPCSQAFAGRQG